MKWDVFFENLALMKEGKAPFTFILDDPLAASHIQVTFPKKRIFLIISFS